MVKRPQWLRRRRGRSETVATTYCLRCGRTHGPNMHLVDALGRRTGTIKALGYPDGCRCAHRPARDLPDLADLGPL